MKWTDFIFSGLLIWLAQLLLADFLSIGTIRPDLLNMVELSEQFQVF